MRLCLHTLVLVIALFGGQASAQEARGWIGVDVQDVSKAEADKLGWDTPRGAKLGLVAAGSPADSVGLKTGDIVVAVDRSIIDTGSELNAVIAGKRPGDEVRLQVLSGGRERRVAVKIAEPPRAQTAGSAALPILMLDPGGHMGKIAGLAFTPDGRQLVSGADDKVVRVWDLQAGRTVRTILGEVGRGPAGQIGSMALSPDGRWLAAGGWMKIAGQPGHVIRLYDFSSGKLMGLLKGHNDTVSSLAFSSDSRRLISGSGGSDVVPIIWDVERQAVLHRLPGHKGDVYAVGFTPDGLRAITGSDDTTLKLWSVKDGRELATLARHRNPVMALAVSPVSGMISSGGEDGEIILWDGSTGTFLRTLPHQNGGVGALVFSRDEKRLLSTCTAGSCNFDQSIWEVASDRKLFSYTKHDNIVFAAALSPDGSLVATAGGNNRQILVWSLVTGETQKVLAGSGAPGFAVGFSGDGQRIAWGTKSHYRSQNDRGPIELELLLPATGRRLGRPERTDPRSFLQARSTLGAYSLTHRKGGSYGYDAILDVVEHGQRLFSIERNSTNGYSHSAYTFTPDGQTIISAGGGGFITAYDLKGQRLDDFVGHDGLVWAVATSPDGRLLISGGSDQTVRIWNLKTRELIVTLFHGRDDEWVMWTPQGYYTGSPGADKIVGWQINKGPEHAAEYVGAEQLRQHLNRPDIVEKAIILASAEQAVREAPGTAFKLADLLARPVPRFKIASQSAGAAERGGRATVKIAIEATPDPVQLIRVHVNGRQVGEQTPEIGSGGFGAGARTLYVPLGKGRNEVRVTLTNAIGEKAETLVLDHEGDGNLDQRGVLHILAIGVNDYKGLGNACGKAGTKSCDLSYPSADARKFADAIEKRLGPGHRSVEKRVLVNGGNPKEAPTSSNIIDAVEDLRQAQETDTVVLFIAGHGSNEGPDYRFLPTNVEWSGSALRGSTVVPWQVLQGAIEGAKGRRLLFVDTCHSGNAYNQRLGNAAYHANIIAYTAARFDQEAIEDTQLGHGLFTYAVVEGLEGKGDLAARRQISTKDLAEYIKGRVSALAQAMQGAQEPQYFKGRDAEDFVLARW